MKTHKSNTLKLKKLTVAKINPEALQLLNGGTSTPTSGIGGASHRIGLNGGFCPQIVR